MARSYRTAFTLVELLVVIGIIALLVAMLLPALQGAQRQASMVQCQSNMRQVALAMMMYIDANGGKHPPNTVPVHAGSQHTFPRGFWWPNELVRGKFVNAPSIYAGPGAAITSKNFNKSNVFRCPEGVPEEYLNPLSLGSTAGLYPTHMFNNKYYYTNDAEAAEDGLGIPSWYQLNSGAVVATNASQATKGVTGATAAGRTQMPFIYYAGSTSHLTSDPAFIRHRGQVRKAAELVMILEASNNNWYNRQSTWPHWPRLGARHGKKTADGKNAWTNFAFFDGHVAQYPTVDFMSDQNTPGAPNMRYQAPIFFINNQSPPK